MRSPLLQEAYKTLDTKQGPAFVYHNSNASFMYMNEMKQEITFDLDQDWMMILSRLDIY